MFCRPIAVAIAITIMIMITATVTFRVGRGSISFYCTAGVTEYSILDGAGSEDRSGCIGCLELCCIILFPPSSQQ